MSDWQPTPELRFVHRSIGDGQWRNVLQQKWTRETWPHSYPPPGKTVTETEWRDVPLVEES